MPALERDAVVRNGHGEGLRREVDRDQRRNIRSREPIARHELDVFQPRLKISIEIRHPLLAALDQRRNLLVAMRTGDGAAFQACGGVSHSLHDGGEAFKLRANIDLNNNLVGVRVLYEVIDSPSGEPSDDGLPPLKLTTARLEFADVHFAYHAGTPVLRGMSFVAQPGKLTALVGPSGGGKSTVLSLILRFYDADAGSILIDGQDIATVSRRSLREETAYVGQIVHLFRGTIRENIALGRLDASEAEIVAAAKAAHAHDFILALPAGYDAQVGEHGLQLSGGQRQRIAVARALIKDAPSCSTRLRRRSTPNPSATSRRRSPNCARGARRL